MKKKTQIITIENNHIGGVNPTFIIAEAGVNHNGQLSIAKQLIDAAASAGADAIKFQTFTPKEVTSKNAPMATYQKNNLHMNKSQLEMLESLTLPFDSFIELQAYCTKKDIIFLSTPHSFDAIDFLENLVPAYKFGSGDLTNIPALTYAAKKNKPILLGTGMATLEEVKNAVNAIYSEGNKQVIVLHCTTNYPCSYGEVNLRAIKTLQHSLQCLVGYSDHSMGTLVAIAAVGMGAHVLEKHFTLDRTMTGPDHQASLEPDELTSLIKEIRKVETILGSPKKQPTQTEKQIIPVVRKSLIANTFIHQGKKITSDMIVIKRPGTGISPSELNTVIGKKAMIDIQQDDIITKNMIEGL